ncbi:hypothetical protein F4054_07660 [Candidatus Poribacteria bacterium]|nr:hypothetical protein [Candidatus Poribacteria bacterium]MYK22121.1 hypothetical protein [Candidatus Poribacteria bacterium]
MIRNFFATPTVVGKLMIALLFVSGAVFAGAFDGFVVETEASCCCDGGTDAEHFSSSSCCGKVTCSPVGKSGNKSNYCTTYTDGKQDDKSQCPGKCSDGNKCGWKGCWGKK